MDKLPGQQYRLWTRLEEGPAPSWTEEEVQRLWFEQAFHPRLRTTDGEEIEVLQAGFWNHGAGPDFLHASLRNGRGEVEHGAVEIHLRARDWIQHGHEQDPAYDPVILHGVWEWEGRDFFPRTRHHQRVRQVELQAHLRLPAEQARALAGTRVDERAAGARLGRCHAALARLEDERLVALLREAGWHRFHIRVARMRARVGLCGPEQALWIGLADALGYSANRAAFIWLARRLPVAELSACPDEATREAFIYGLGGLLPGRRLERKDSWARQVWEVWWKLRGRDGDGVLPRTRWALRGLRPANRPERRAAVLALLAAPERWRPFWRVALRGNGDEVASRLAELHHPFWSHHFTWTGRASARPSALVGSSRVAGFLFNTVWPLAWEHDAGEVERQLASARSPLENHSSRLAAFRLLAGRRLRGHESELLVREGLIQIYQDFCLRSDAQCGGCDFPVLVEEWKKKG